MSETDIRQLLEALASGRSTVDEVAACLDRPIERTAVTTDARVDLDRADRCGFAEVVYCSGKTPESVTEIFVRLRRHGHDCFGTRCDAEMADQVIAKLPEVRYNPVARTLNWQAESDRRHSGQVPVLAAGTSDRPVAEEAFETLRWMRLEPEMFLDVGVAGPHRLAEILPEIQDSRAIVVAAGMEGALPSVVGGHVACPVIAVPTSVGYGASFGGLAALLGMLNSCAANVTVVNIDAGFKAGYLAGLITTQADRTGD